MKMKANLEDPSSIYQPLGPPHHQPPTINAVPHPIPTAQAKLQLFPSENVKFVKDISVRILEGELKNMESVPASLYNGIKRYWKRNGYERLNGNAGWKRKIRVVKLTSANGTNRRRRRFWRVKLKPSLKLKFKFSPKRLLRRLRDAYVNMMMKIANTPGIAGAGGFPGGGAGGSGFGRGPMKEYDERIITEIYKSVLMAQSGLVPREETRIGSEIICQR